jgi:hypothetical protein
MTPDPFTRIFAASDGLAADNPLRLLPVLALTLATLGDIKPSWFSPHDLPASSYVRTEDLLMGWDAALTCRAV